MEHEGVSNEDYLANNFGYCIESPYTDPLIEVYSVTLSPSHSSFWTRPDVKSGVNFSIYGAIHVVDSRGRKIQLYHRPRDDPETITFDDTSTCTTTLLLTGCPKTAVIKMDGKHKIIIDLKLHDYYPRSRPRHKYIPQTRGACFANGDLCFTEPDHLAYHQDMSVTLEGVHVNVNVHYTYIPFAQIAQVSVLFRQEEEEDSSHLRVIGRTDGQLHGKITACYEEENNCVIGKNDSDSHGKITACYEENNSVIGKNDSESHPLILFDQMSSEPAPVHFGHDIILRTSLVCIPPYCSLSVKLDNFIFSKDNQEIDFSKDFKFKCGLIRSVEELSIDNVQVTVFVHRFANGDPEEHILVDPLGHKYAILACPNPQIQVLSIFVGHGCNTQVDICGYVALDRLNMIFDKEDKGCPSPTLELERVISYPGDGFGMDVRLKSEGHVDINNYFGIGEYEYCLIGGNWHNRPLCKVVLGMQGFAAVHFMVSENAVKATVKISVLPKDSNAPRPYGSVYGTLVARYGNYEYLTEYRKKYWSIDLLQVEKEGAQSLSKDGEISLFRDVVSVPKGSYLILAADLYVTRSSDGRVYRFKEEVKMKIRGDGRTIKRTYPIPTYRRPTFRVVVTTNW